jgi:type IV pilus assembly protein PilV
MRADAMRHFPFSPLRQRGTSLVEVLVTVIVLAFGLLGIAALQAKAQVGNLEAYQRAQAVVLLQDMRARMSSNGANAASYVTSTPLGTGTSADDCSGAADAAARDKCEWSNELKGAAEVSASSTKVGAMLGARGCIEVLQAPNPAAGVCQPGLYRLSVVWQGMHPTKVSSLTCGKNAFGTDDSYRRAIAVQVAVGLPACS